MKILERISPVGPWLVQPVTAIVECSPAEADTLPGVVWAGRPRFCGDVFHAHLEGRDTITAGLIMTL